MKMILTKQQWEQIGKTAGWVANNGWNDPDESPTKIQSLITTILKHPKADIVAAIKSLGEESIAGFSGVTEEDVEEIIAMSEEYVLGEILGCMEKHPQMIQAWAKWMVKKANIPPDNMGGGEFGNQGEGGEGQEGQPGGEIKFDPKFDVKKAIQTPQQAESFLIDMLRYMPDRFHLFLGLEKTNIMERMRRYVPTIIQSLKSQVGEQMVKEFLKGPGKLKDYNDAMELMNRAAVGTLMTGKSLLLPLLGFPAGSREVVDRLRENAPYMIKPMDIPTEIVPAEKEEYLNTVLDDFNAGKIDEKEMKRRLREYAGNLKITLIKTADNKMVLKKISQ